MAAFLNGPGCDVGLSEIVEELQFLNQASGGTKPQSYSTSDGVSRDSANNTTRIHLNPEQGPASGVVSTSESRKIHPLKGLSKLVKGIGDSGCKSHTEKSNGGGVATKPNRLKRKATTDHREGSVRRDCIPQSTERKQPKRSVGVSVAAVTDDDVVPDVNNIQSWSDGLIESWDACIFTPTPKETQQNIPPKETHQSVPAVDSDSEELPSNQEAYRREIEPVVDNQDIVRLIQDSNQNLARQIQDCFKTLERRIGTFEEQLAVYNRRLEAVENKVEDHHNTAANVQQQ
ncbi:hypothetical protein QQF64_027205 [Cirrhinus molitorella]|uniref:Uncharacterized protein n=1 Tax=Cirrhinus molitorella TaxID=172907 RepID=A0ABR3NBQ4_9TELE